MTTNRKFDRRQFVRKSLAAGAAVAATTFVTRSTKGCPVFFDENGVRADYWCVIEVDSSNPFYTIYTWKNCVTGETRFSLGEGDVPLGDCGKPEEDGSCMELGEIDACPTTTIGKTLYFYKPEDAKFAKLAVRMLQGKK